MIGSRMHAPAGGDIDDGATAGLSQDRDGCTTDPKRCFDVDGEGGGVVIVCRLGDRAPADDTRVVDDDVEAAQLSGRFLRQFITKCGVSSVPDNRNI